MPELKNDILYIDLNSCFASIEQQCRPMLRGRPVAITNRLVPNSCIITASYEAKAKGVKVGMRAREASAICPGIVFAESEPSKYIFVHEKLKRIMRDYSPNVVMKSIDEGVIDLKDAPQSAYQRSRYELGAELKHRLKTEIGCHMRCNIGIASNRFLAKLAGELHKPDGLDEITEDNQREIFAKLKLTDLPGINVRMEARLNAVGIFTPLQFLDADEMTLVKLVCKSIEGHKWYRRLRGFEVDDVTYGIKSIGREYVLDSRNLTHQETEQRLVHLAEDVGYRLRSKNLYARGIYVWTYDFINGHRHRQTILKEAIHTDHDIARVARELFKNLDTPVFIIGITLYKLQTQPNAQLCLEQDQKDRHAAICTAEDAINLRFGARKIHCADTLGTEQIKCKVPFGSTRFLDHSIT